MSFLTPHATRQLLLIRHARPEHVEGVADGADPGLTDLGRRQAKAMADWLVDEDIVAIHTSTARRAIETAAPLVDHFGLTPTAHDGLLEYDWGTSEYIPFEKMRADGHPKLALWREVLNTPIADSEVIQLFVKRVCETIDGILEQHDEGTVAIVSHGGTLNAWVANLLGARTIFVTRTEYAGYSRAICMDVDRSGTRWVMDSLNEAPYLYGTDMATRR